MLIPDDLDIGGEFDVLCLEGVYLMFYLPLIILYLLHLGVHMGYFLVHVIKVSLHLLQNVLPCINLFKLHIIHPSSFLSLLSTMG